MDMPNENTENTPGATKYCKKDAENAKEYMKSFVNASLDDHKACFKANWQKMIGKFQQVKSDTLKGGKD
ncbi:hypothetical protein L2E82_43729 [Cichorium intybus]|uniref:Uncharacterized protein n=1 Tax=Cichorium intybus TaxID=13427 RepID=A0ACB8ZNM6_CICIN|nr:hypothetical protein L2E82_43729 [Cichorium intybus]